MRFITCADGSFVGALHITRLFARPDAVKNCWDVCASIAGPQHPFVIATYDTEQAAKLAVKHMVQDLGVS